MRNDKEQPNFTIKEAKPIPFWQVLHNDLTEDLKEQRYIKAIYRHSVGEINEIIKQGKIWCDDCDKPMEIKLPKNFKDLEEFTMNIINKNCCQICYDCEIKTIKQGRVLGTDKEGWNPDKEELLKKVREEHSQRSQK